MSSGFGLVLGCGSKPNGYLFGNYHLLLIFKSLTLGIYQETKVLIPTVSAKSLFFLQPPFAIWCSGAFPRQHWFLLPPHLDAYLFQPRRRGVFRAVSFLSFLDGTIDGRTLGLLLFRYGFEKNHWKYVRG